jgi:hypothetical protein
MLYKIWMSFIRIINWERIPKLPRGMLASHYEDVAGDEWRVMARLGSRDFAGVKRAMKQHDCKTIEELVAKLEHQQPRRNIRHRLRLAIGRVVGGHETDPHRAEIIIALNRGKKSNARAEIEQRIKIVRKELK